MSAMDPCPYTKKGDHHLSFVLPPDVDHDVIVVCDRCGDGRRIPITPPETVTLDDMPADFIKRVSVFNT